MIAGCWVLLLIAGLMLLVDDNQSQMLERQEHSRTGPKDDIVWIFRQLLLPYLHTLCIRIAGVIDAQPVTEHALQTLHHLYRQGYLWHQEQYLFLSVQRPLYQVDIDFGFATRRHAMQQCHRLLHHRQQYLVICLRLGRAQWFDQFRTIRASMV